MASLKGVPGYTKGTGRKKRRRLRKSSYKKHTTKAERRGIRKQFGKEYYHGKGYIW